MLFPLSLAIFTIATGSKDIRLVLLILFVEAAYKPVLEKRFGTTLGKRILGLRVISTTGAEAISWNQSFLRFLPWAISYYTTVFVYTRYFQSPGFAEVVEVEAFRDFIYQHPLNESTLVGLLSSMPFFSATWAMTDLLRRTIHDRLAKTVVIAPTKAFAQTPK